MQAPIRQSLYPVQMQGDRFDANDAMAECMLHVFDIKGEVMAFEMLSKKYLHVIAWDASGDVIREYDNR